jgi:exodeoxyribonuclease VII large subunit
MSPSSPLAPGATPADPGIPGSGLAGPFPVGEYAAALRRRLRSFTHVQLVGELVNLRAARARVYFELRDSLGAVPCAVWQKDRDSILARVGDEAPAEGMQVAIVARLEGENGTGTP